MFGLVPGGSVHIKIIHQFLRFIVIGFRLTVKCGFYIFRREEMLMNIILPVSINWLFIKSPLAL